MQFVTYIMSFYVLKVIFESNMQITYFLPNLILACLPSEQFYGPLN